MILIKTPYPEIPTIFRYRGGNSKGNIFQNLRVLNAIDFRKCPCCTFLEGIDKLPNHSSNIRIPSCVIHIEMLSTQFSQNPTHMYHPFVPSTRVYHVHRFVIRRGVPSAQVCHLLSCVMNMSTAN